MTDEDSDFSELDLVFTRRVPNATQRVQQALAPWGVVGLIEGQQYLERTTAVSINLTGVAGKSVSVADAAGQLKSPPLRDGVHNRLLAGIGPEVGFLEEECVYGTPRPDWADEERLQSWAIFAGPGRRAEHLVIASVKDKGTRWRYWEENGCGFAHHGGEQRYRQFNFPADAGTVIEPIPSDQELTATVFAGSQRLDRDFSGGLLPVASFAQGSPAAKLLETVLANWPGFTPETFEQLGVITGNARAAAELERTLNNGAGHHRVGRTAPKPGQWPKLTGLRAEWTFPRFGTKHRTPGHPGSGAGGARRSGTTHRQQAIVLHRTATAQSCSLGSAEARHSDLREPAASGWRSHGVTLHR